MAMHPVVTAFQQKYRIWRSPIDHPNMKGIQCTLSAERGGVCEMCMWDGMVVSG